MIFSTRLEIDNSPNILYIVADCYFPFDSQFRSTVHQVVSRVV
jgi:hypothetical protein